MNFEREQGERVSRQQAAERLTDIAYALTAAPPLQLRIAGEQLTVSIPDDLLLKGQMTSNADRIELELEISWSTAGITQSE
jgi:amphi-Trp domain-containing protein